MLISIPPGGTDAAWRLNRISLLEAALLERQQAQRTPRLYYC
jgi:hypothetical protein